MRQPTLTTLNWNPPSTMSSWSTFQPRNISPPPSPEPAYLRRDRVRTVVKGSTAGTHFNALDPWKPNKPVFSTDLTVDSKPVARSRLAGDQSVSPTSRSRSQTATPSRFDSYSFRPSFKSPSHPNPNAPLPSPASASVPSRRTSTAPWELYTGSPSNIIDASGSSRSNKSNRPITALSDPVPATSSVHHNSKTSSTNLKSDPTISHKNDHQPLPVQLYVSVPAVQKEVSGSSSLTWSSKASIPLRRTRTRTNSLPRPSSISIGDENGDDKIITPSESSMPESANNTSKKPTPCQSQVTNDTSTSSDAYPDTCPSVQDLPSQDAASTTAAWLALRESESDVGVFLPRLAITSSSMTVIETEDRFPLAEGVCREGVNHSGYDEWSRVTELESKALVEPERNRPPSVLTPSHRLNQPHSTDTTSTTRTIINESDHDTQAISATHTRIPESGSGSGSDGIDHDAHHDTAFQPSSFSSVHPSTEALSQPPGGLTVHAHMDIARDDLRVMDIGSSSTTTISLEDQDSLALRPRSEPPPVQFSPALQEKENAQSKFPPRSRPPSSKGVEREGAKANSAKDDAGSSFCCCVIS